MVLTSGSNFTGEFQHALDAKNRVTVPSKWRPGKESEKATFLLIPMPAGFVGVFPERMIEDLNEKARKISLGDRKGQRALRRLFTLADTVVCDGHGRITLGEKLLEHAAINKDSVLAGMLTHFEIWSPERYETQFEQEDAVEDDDTISAILRELGF